MPDPSQNTIARLNLPISAAKSEQARKFGELLGDPSGLKAKIAQLFCAYAGKQIDGLGYNMDMFVRGLYRRLDEKTVSELKALDVGEIAAEISKAAEEKISAVQETAGKAETKTETKIETKTVQPAKQVPAPVQAPKEEIPAGEKAENKTSKYKNVLDAVQAYVQEVFSDLEKNVQKVKSAVQEKLGNQTEKKPAGQKTEEKKREKPRSVLTAFSDKKFESAKSLVKTTIVGVTAKIGATRKSTVAAKNIVVKLSDIKLPEFKATFQIQALKAVSAGKRFARKSNIRAWRLGRTVRRMANRKLSEEDKAKFNVKSLQKILVQRLRMTEKKPNEEQSDIVALEKNLAYGMRLMTVKLHLFHRQLSHGLMSGIKIVKAVQGHLAGAVDKARRIAFKLFKFLKFAGNAIMWTVALILFKWLVNRPILRWIRKNLIEPAWRFLKDVLWPRVIKPVILRAFGKILGLAKTIIEPFVGIANGFKGMAEDFISKIDPVKHPRLNRLVAVVRKISDLASRGFKNVSDFAMTAGKTLMNMFKKFDLIRLLDVVYEFFTGFFYGKLKVAAWQASVWIIKTISTTFFGVGPLVFDLITFAFRGLLVLQGLLEAAIEDTIGRFLKEREQRKQKNEDNAIAQQEASLEDIILNKVEPAARAVRTFTDMKSVMSDIKFSADTIPERKYKTMLRPDLKINIGTKDLQKQSKTQQTGYVKKAAKEPAPKSKTLATAADYKNRSIDVQKGFVQLAAEQIAEIQKYEGTIPTTSFRKWPKDYKDFYHNGEIKPEYQYSQEDLTTRIPLEPFEKIGNKLYSFGKPGGYLNKIGLMPLSFTTPGGLAIFADINEVKRFIAKAAVIRWLNVQTDYSLQTGVDAELNKALDVHKKEWSNMFNGALSERFMSPSNTQKLTKAFRELNIAPVELDAITAKDKLPLERAETVKSAIKGDQPSAEELSDNLDEKTKQLGIELAKRENTNQAKLEELRATLEESLNAPEKGAVASVNNTYVVQPTNIELLPDQQPAFA